MTEAPIHEASEAMPRADLNVAQRDEMFRLLARHFEGVTPQQFERDLSEKNWVLSFRREGRLVGFSTLLACPLHFDGSPITAIYSGDTIMAPEARGSQALARTWIATVNRLRAEFPQRPCHWLLLTSGFRTYRFLPVFWREFYPRFDVPTPPREERLLRTLARERYRDSFEEHTGIVRFPQPQRLRLHPGSAFTGRAADPHVAFFLGRNPGHHAGDELVCLAEISERNMTPAGRRMLT